MLVSDGVHDAMDTRLIQKLRDLHPQEPPVGPMDISHIPTLVPEDSIKEDSAERQLHLPGLCAPFRRSPLQGPPAYGQVTFKTV